MFSSILIHPFLTPDHQPSLQRVPVFSFLCVLQAHAAFTGVKDGRCGTALKQLGKPAYFRSLDNVVIGNNWKSARLEECKRAQRRVDNKQKTEIGVGLENQYEFDTNSQSSLTFVFLLNFLGASVA